MIRSEHADELLHDELRRVAVHATRAAVCSTCARRILGHVQQGGAPSPFDRIEATRLASAGVEHLIDRALADDPTSAMVGLRDGQIVFTPLAELPAPRPSATSNGRANTHGGWRYGPLVDIMAQAPPEPPVSA